MSHGNNLFSQTRMQRSSSLDSLAGELGEARNTIEKLKKQRRICKWMSIVLWINLILGIITLITIRMSYLLEWEIMTGNIILAEINVNRENITGFNLSVWGTVGEKRKEIEKNNVHFCKWLNNVRTDKTLYYMIRQPKVKIKSTVKMKQWYRSETDIFRFITTTRDRHVGSRKTGYVELENQYEMKFDLELNQSVPWVWKKRIAMPRVKFNFKTRYFYIY